MARWGERPGHSHRTRGPSVRSGPARPHSTAHSRTPQHDPTVRTWLQGTAPWQEHTAQPHGTAPQHSPTAQPDPQHSPTAWPHSRRHPPQEQPAPALKPQAEPQGCTPHRGAALTPWGTPCQPPPPHGEPSVGPAPRPGPAGSTQTPKRGALPRCTHSSWHRGPWGGHSTTGHMGCPTHTQPGAHQAPHCCPPAPAPPLPFVALKASFPSHLLVPKLPPQPAHAATPCASRRVGRGHPAASGMRDEPPLLLQHPPGGARRREAT